MRIGIFLGGQFKRPCSTRSSSSRKPSRWRTALRWPRKCWRRIDHRQNSTISQLYAHQNSVNSSLCLVKPFFFKFYNTGIYVPFDGIEHSIPTYEVLIQQKRCKYNKRIKNRMSLLNLYTFYIQQRLGCHQRFTHHCRKALF